LAKSAIEFQELPNFLVILAKSSAALKAYVEAEEALARGRLSPQQREQVALAVGEINGSAYDVAAHQSTSREAELTVADVRLAQKAAATDPKAGAMLRFVQALVLQRGEISDEDLGRLRKAGFAEAEIVEIVANVALNIFMNYLNLVARTEIEPSQVQSCEEDRRRSQASSDFCPRTRFTASLAPTPLSKP
jgi:uncharacterized peroxidase-related enzyme